jgi:manganese/zinc/iron transport system permease protein
MMGWTGLDTWIVVAGVLCAMSCALLGNFLVLRKMSMMGDAISHAVLPGLAMAFWFTGARSSWAMFVGAAALGILTAVLTQGLSRFGRVDEGASMGVVFTLLFALGLIMIMRGAAMVDLDPGCVLYGAIELTPLDRLTIAGVTMPRAVWMLGAVLVLNLLFVAVFYKELKLTSFDECFAQTIGYRPAVMHYVLMTLVAITAVAAFESVGSILVIAMLIVPGATAFLLSRSLPMMIGWSVAVAWIAAVGGHLAAITVPRLWGFNDTTTAGSMAVVAGLCFVAAFVAAPRSGVWSRYRHRRHLRRTSAGLFSDISGKIRTS